MAGLMDRSMDDYGISPIAPRPTQTSRYLGLGLNQSPMDNSMMAMTQSPLLQQSPVPSEVANASFMSQDEIAEYNPETLRNTLETQFRLRQEDPLLEPFAAVDQFYGIVDDTAHRILQSTSEATLSMQRQHDLVNMCNLLKQERNTWSLIGSVYRARLSSEETGPAPPDFDALQCSDKQAINKLYGNNSDMLLAQLVIEWLEHIAGKDYQPSGTTDSCHGWENTLKQLENGPPTDAVLALDLDAPQRQYPRKLHAEDAKFDNNLMAKVLGFIRIGEKEQAEKVCRDSSQPWRAATLQGWRLSHDSRVFGAEVTDDNGMQGDGDPHERTGNGNRDVWKLAALEMSHDTNNNMSVAERAVYGALSGNLAGTLQACETWEDQLWAYYTVMVDMEVEKELRQPTRGGRQRDLVELPEWYQQQNLSPRTIVESLESSNIQKVNDGAHEEFHKIQSYLILNDIEELMIYMSGKAKEAIKTPDQKQFLRFYAQLVVFFRDMGIRAADGDEGDGIILDYVNGLIATAKQLQIQVDQRGDDNSEDDIRDLQDAQTSVAVYLACLPESLQNDKIKVYSDFLNDIKDKEDRMHVYEAARTAGLPIDEITKTVVETTRRQGNDPFQAGQPEFEQEDTDAKKRTDELKIDAIDWLTLDQSTGYQALYQSNAIMRHFIAAENIDNVQEVLLKLPRKLIQQVEQETDDEMRAVSPVDVVREHVCIQAWITASSAFNSWKEFKDQHAPEEFQEITSNVYTEQLQQDHKRRQHEQRVQRYQQQVHRLMTSAEHKMLAMLQFERGWLVDIDDASDRPVDEDAQTRQGELNELSEQCIPDMCLKLHELYFEMQDYKKCIGIADMIASVESEMRLYKIFKKRKHLLKILLKQIANASTKIVEGMSDPLGYYR